METAAPPVAHRRQRVGNVTLYQVRGVAAPTDILHLFQDFLADPTPIVVWDMRECRVSHMTGADVRRVVIELLRMNQQNPVRGKSAFICPDAPDFERMRTLAAYAEANDYGYQLDVFSNGAEAREWLQGA